MQSLLRLRGGALSQSCKCEALAEPASTPVVFAPVGLTKKVQVWNLREALACVPKALLLPGWEVPAELSLCFFGKPLPPLVDLVLEEVARSVLTRELEEKSQATFGEDECECEAMQSLRSEEIGDEKDEKRRQVQPERYRWWMLLGVDVF